MRDVTVSLFELRENETQLTEMIYSLYGIFVDQNALHCSAAAITDQL